MAYVYLHKKDNGSIFYVGKGNNYRAWKKSNRSKYWNRVKNKYGLNVVIFKDNMTEEDAFSLERELISAIGLENLTNHTSGGEGILGFKHSEETKKKMSQSQKGGTSWSKGLKLSKKHREGISKGNKGKKRSKEQLKVMSEISKGTHYTNNSTDVLSNTKIAIKYKLNDFAVWINGVEVNTDSSGITPTGLNTLNFDRGTGGNVFVGKVKDLQVFTTALTDEQLAALTTI